MFNQIRRVILSYNYSYKINSSKTASFLNSVINSKGLTTARTMLNNDVECMDLVWMDLEMTGLDVQKDKIMEISCIITNKNLEIISEGPCFAIQQSQEVIDQMNDWCNNHHYESGLVGKCLNSQISITKAEDIILAYLKDNIPESKCPLAGNSIYMDRLFLRQYMPKVDEYLHYRIVDVSTVKELVRRWQPKLLEGAPKKKFTHRSLDDIKDSIAELEYYKQHFFNIS